MARKALITVMTIFFSCLALDIAVPAIVLAAMYVLSEVVFVVGDALVPEGKAA
ncbi:MAG: hypothetical protein QHC90_24925 [Shinella sp.]|nr:hypothetical protein [Shinella sp.]